jgi:hypothetical protein
MSKQGTSNPGIDTTTLTGNEGDSIKVQDEYTILLAEILSELRIHTQHLQLMTDEVILLDDLEEH